MILCVTPHRFSKRPLDGPAKNIQPCGQGAILDVYPLGPLHHSESFAVVGNHMITSLVVGLLMWCGPSAILRRIWTVVIFPVKAMALGRGVPHIIIKVFKRIKPAVTNLNTAPAVILVACTIWVVAAFKHALPSAEDGSIRHAVRFDGFSSTSAGGGLSRFKIAVLNHAHSATVTPACPKISFPAPVYFLTGISKYKPVAEALACQVFDVFRGWDKLIISHCNSLLVMVVRGAFGVYGVGRSSFVYAPNYTTFSTDMPGYTGE